MGLLSELEAYYARIPAASPECNNNQGWGFILSTYMLAAIIGIAAVGLLPSLPSVLLPCVLALALVCSLLRRFLCGSWAGLALCCLLGMSWSTAYGLRLVAQQLPAGLELVELTVQGRVIGLPLRGERHGKPALRFELAVDAIDCPGSAADCGDDIGHLRLSWLDPPPLRPGQRWQLAVKLKRPHGMMNPAGFDYQSWLVFRGVGATGYVLTAADNRLLGVDRWSLHYWRGRLAHRLEHALADLQQGALLRALLIADKRGLDSDQWRRFQRHGVVHLLVISGLHIGLVSALVLMLSRQLCLLTPWRRCAHAVAALLSLSAALCYCLAAGASLPTQRALVAVTVVMVAQLRRRDSDIGRSLLLALLLCLLLDPLAPFAASFWLSFGAVAVLLFGLSGRLGGPRRLAQLLRSQWLIALGLAPVLIVCTGQLSLLAPLVNLLALPLFTLVIVPLALAGALWLPLSPALSAWLWRLSDTGLVVFQQLLLALERWLPPTHGYVPVLPPLLIVAMAVAGLVLIAPRGLPMKGLALVMALLVLSYRPPPLANGDLNLTVLDVGQGLTVVVETAAGTLVYDVGPRYQQGRGRVFTTADAALLPFLRSRGLRRVDTLVLSHADNDHAGGWRELLRELPVSSLYSGEPVAQLSTESCHRGQSWRWGGVRFQFLTVAEGNDSSINSTNNSGNNRSCVLLISAAGHHFLLPGDIETPVEQALVRRYGGALAAAVLVAPHHGSHSSSSWALLKQVRPQHVVFSCGYRNPFGHPHASVVRRYQQQGSVLHATPRHGAVAFRLRSGRLLTPTHYRQRLRRYWL